MMTDDQVRRFNELKPMLERIAQKRIDRMELTAYVNADEVVALARESIEEAKSKPVFVADKKFSAEEKFRNYIVVTICNKVSELHRKQYGLYVCGNCESFVARTRRERSHCTRHELVISGVPYHHVNASTRPGRVEHPALKEGKGCIYFERRQVVQVDEIDHLIIPREEEVNVSHALKRMKSLGKRQKRMALIIRLKNHGLTRKKIGKKLGINVTQVSELLRGTTEKVDDGTGTTLVYHQAGAADLLEALRTERSDELKKVHPGWWAVVSLRDFSKDDPQLRFDEISRFLDITEQQGSDRFKTIKLQAIERYINGWNWIGITRKRRSKIMPGEKPPTGGKSNPPNPGQNSLGNTDNVERIQSTARITEAEKLVHPDFSLLLEFAEDGLEREVRKRIALHLTLCESCSAEEEFIETEILPEMERPITVTERLRVLATEVVVGARDLGSRVKSGLRPADSVKWMEWGPAPSLVRGSTLKSHLTIRPPAPEFSYLTLLDKDQEGALYAVIVNDEVVFNYQVNDSEVKFSFETSNFEGHTVRGYLSTRPVVAGVEVDLNINDPDQKARREQWLAAFFESQKGEGEE